ncbi:helix-turn-helix domain-containing protein [Streptomyces sp. SID335]|nr:helix-turn-helix domain-containing protein [Streptomyces sp. SID335]MYZ19027.1 helix-turn-helix domain-containing protein [Streptomyces sp. SID337]NDZ89430.1 helix-turn-helix domain-containing protein [Streptomyces sp. SID10115]NEA03749.1 helix-turn-helix domain-containing protein [Streptomyces sp. SID10116]NEB44728.1 helix-turn-helix domain-containing protein [Streptomyces sp. SID339]
MDAAEMFAAGQGTEVAAEQLRVSVRSVQRWCRAWQEAGQQGLRSMGPASRPALSQALFAVLEQELAKGPVAYVWPDQTWTLARLRTLIGRRFHKSFTLFGLAKRLQRHGVSHQVPARRALERAEEKLTGWVKEAWPQAKAPWRRSGPGSAHDPRNRAWCCNGVRRDCWSGQGCVRVACSS